MCSVPIRHTQFCSHFPTVQYSLRYPRLVLYSNEPVKARCERSDIQREALERMGLWPRRHSSFPMKAKLTTRYSFVDYDSSEKNHQILAGGKLVQYEFQADVKVFIVNYESQANICITRENFPK